MSAPPSLALAQIVLAVHVVVILFNLFGIIAIPLGGWRGWTFVRGFWWRALHVAALAAVAVQAVAGRACFLTVWQDVLARSTAGHTPLIVRWVNGVIFWPLPLWVFAALYVVVFVYVLGLLWLVPPAWPRRRRYSRLP
ncbi:MAG: DUF2784 family protein [Acetobacteraceae bacterium]